MTDPEILAAFYNNCDPVKPAGEKFYVDCTEVRGGKIFAVNICAELELTTGRIHSLFTGHIGCGKSSELKHLADQMKSPPPGKKRFLPVIVNMSEYLDEYDVSTTDILLAIVTELADVLRREQEIEIADSLLRRRWDELKDYLGSDVEINEGEFSWPWGKAKVQRLRTDPEARKQVRDKLLPQTGRLLDEINLAFVEARTKLKGAMPRDGGGHYSDFVLILDNLEKVQRLHSNAPGDASQRALFIEGAPQLTALDAHVVFTVPLSLARSEGNLLAQTYSRDLFILPMVKTEHRGQEHKPFDMGREKLRELLVRRVPAGASLESLFDEEALDFLIVYSAGHVRNLMMFAREAILYAGGKLPVPEIAVQRAIAQTVSVVVPLVRPHDWELLARVEASNGQEWNNNGEEQRRLLENLCVMEYINGGDQNLLKKGRPWYGVNPILRVQDDFEDALKVEQARRTAAQSAASAP